MKHCEANLGRRGRLGLSYPTEPPQANPLLYVERSGIAAPVNVAHALLPPYMCGYDDPDGKEPEVINRNIGSYISITQ